MAAKKKKTQAAFRLTDQQLAVLDAAAKQYGLSNRAEALRLILKQWSDQAQRGA